MKYTSILKLGIAIFAFSLLSSPTLYAQSDKKKAKKEKKRIKKELKKYMKDTESYNSMITGYRDNINDLESEVDELTESNTVLSDRNKLLVDSLDALKNKIETLEYNLEKASNNGASIFKNKGIEYRVQIGAYRNFDLTPFLTDNQVVGYEYVDGMYHYFIGSWANADDAYEFAQKFNELDIDDAFVSKYIDGVRVDFDYFNQ